jgi:hypothetical protein
MAMGNDGSAVQPDAAREAKPRPAKRFFAHGEQAGGLDLLPSRVAIRPLTGRGS